MAVEASFSTNWVLPIRSQKSSPLKRDCRLGEAHRLLLALEPIVAGYVNLHHVCRDAVIVENVAVSETGTGEIGIGERSKRLGRAPLDGNIQRSSRESNLNRTW